VSKIKFTSYDNPNVEFSTIAEELYLNAERKRIIRDPRFAEVGEWNYGPWRYSVEIQGIGTFNIDEKTYKYLSEKVSKDRQ
jgi:hypothetical protein